MQLKEQITRFTTNLFLEHPIRALSLAQLRGEMVTLGKQLEERLPTIPDTERNRHFLRHIIGQERWMQARLRWALGAARIMEESDGYYPAKELSWQVLAEEFRKTRQESIALAEELEQAGVDGGTFLPHNQLGDLSVRAWLRYLTQHAHLESKRIR
ncbi:MAG: DinB family protein [Ardenticatenales bacterium]|nr:DinB family protein [Ardenticatenales bacterium]